MPTVYRRQMGDIINLRQARKALKRQQRAAQSDVNRIRYGRTKAQRLADDADRDKANRSLDGARREHDLVSPCQDPVTD